MIRKRYLVLFALALALFWLLPAQAQNPDDGRSAPGATILPPNDG